MTPRASSLLLLIALLFGCGGEPVTEVEGEALPPIRARVEVDRAVATTGDVIEYEVHVDHSSDVVARLPEVGDEIGGFRIIDGGEDPPREEGGRTILRAYYRLRADLVGSYILPAATVEYEMVGETLSLETSEIFVEVESVLPGDGAATDIRDVKELREIRGGFPWLPVLLGALVLAGLVAWLLWRRRAREMAAVPARPPHELAFEALARLRQTDFDDLEELRRYYFEISEVVRTYVERRFGLNATDLTTEEILPQLRGLFDAELEDRLRQFLVGTDGVRYAAQVPETREIEATYEAALSFVEATVPAPEETEAEDESEAAREDDREENVA